MFIILSKHNSIIYIKSTILPNYYRSIDHPIFDVIFSKIFFYNKIINVYEMFEFLLTRSFCKKFKIILFKFYIII